MARRRTVFSKGGYYHIYNRGCNRQEIFHTEENYLFLTRKILDLAPEHSIGVIAYCLMPNHYHFLLKQEGDESAGFVVQLIFNSYTKAFNARYSRTGTLFEGPFKSIQVESREYLVHLCRYIHRNPLEAGLVTKPEHWRHSNFLECVGPHQSGSTAGEFITEHFANSIEYSKFVTEYRMQEPLFRSMRKYVFD